QARARGLSAHRRDDCRRGQADAVRHGGRLRGRSTRRQHGERADRLRAGGPPLAMKTVYSDRHRLHDPQVEFSGGRFVPGFEIPRRAEMVLARVQETNLGPVVAPGAVAPEAIARVHDHVFVEFLTTGHEEWRKVYGDSAAIPATWIGPAMRRKLPNSIG